MIDFIEDNDEHTATGIHSSNEFFEHSIGWPTGERDLFVFIVLKQHVADVGKHPVLCVNLTAVNHDGLNLPPNGLAFDFEMVANVVGHGGFSCPGYSVNGHVRGDVAFQCLPEVVRHFLHLCVSVWEVIGAMVVPENFLVLEEGFL